MVYVYIYIYKGKRKRVKKLGIKKIKKKRRENEIDTGNAVGDIIVESFFFCFLLCHMKYCLLSKLSFLFY